MSEAYLGKVFDIHGGGLDLIFPHHENELAQSRCAHGTPMMASVWMHNGFVQIEDEKMSKSLGNFVTIRELRADWPGEVLRFNMLKTHYRSPIDWTVKGLEESKKTLDHWYKVIGDDTQPAGEIDEQVLGPLFDDLNTSNAMTRLHGIVTEIRGNASGPAQPGLKGRLKASAQVLGLLEQTESKYLSGDPKAIAVDETAVKALMDRRVAARVRKDFTESDRIRDELAAMGVVLKDGKDPATGEPVTTWEIAR
jgi:cysteinyl-tRNA synthetase